MKKQHKKAAFFISLLIIINLIIGAFILFQPKVKFTKKNIDVEINSAYDTKSNIKNLNKLNPQLLSIDDSQLNLTTLGTYPIHCKYKNKTYTYQVNIKDTIAPQFNIHEGTLEQNETLDPNSLVSDIVDNTKTTVRLKKDYTFNTPGEYNISILVEDEGKNITEKQTKITVLPPDTTPPTITGTKDYTLFVGEKADFSKNVTVSDDRDTNPTLTINSDEIDFNTPGVYKIYYTATDKNKNETSITQNVTVKSVVTDQNKTVYLTFDDGPSHNTSKVLEVLNRYNIKATFFVIGTNPQYYHLIKEAHQQGHTIGLHSYSHNYSNVYASKESYFNDLNQIGEVVKNQIGYVPKYIRFPGGSSNTISANYTKGIMSDLSQAVHLKGYEYYDWNVGSGDADGNNVPFQKIIKNATNSNANQIMILFHDTDAKNTTIEALPAIIEYYRVRGYQFKAINENSYVSHHGINN